MKRHICFALLLLTVLSLLFCSCAKQQDIVFVRISEENSQPSATDAVQTENPSPEDDNTGKAEYESISPESSGENVKLLQQRLSELGFLHTDSFTDYYGKKTEYSVALFERQHGLSEDGIADSEMLSLLYSDDAEKCSFALGGYTVGIDPGHQSKANSEMEAVAPGSDKTKKKVSSGTEGVSSKVAEYEVNLQVGLKLKKLLEENGAYVVMTRETNDVNISNIERAEFFNENKTDYAIRLHCNGSDNSSIKGAFILIPEEGSEKDNCKRAADILINSFCDATRANNLGVVERDDQTCFNWCTRMIVNIEMGHMSNAEEDRLLVSDDYQNKMAQGICDGIIGYFA